MRASLLSSAAALLCSFGASAQTVTERMADHWSESSNPSGHWSWREGSNPLPHVNAWQRNLGGWSTFQPAWAESEDGSNRLPVFYRSNGSETFPCDIDAGDIIVHSTDPSSGAGNGPSSAAFECPFDGRVTITGHSWQARDIGRSNSWTLYRRDQRLSGGQLTSTDPYSRSNPFQFEDGDGGSAAITRVRARAGDLIRLQIDRTSSAGDFVGMDITVTIEAACPADQDDDGFVTGLDFDGFVAAFEAGTGDADFNGDGFVTGQDFDDYVLSFEAGC